MRYFIIVTLCTLLVTSCETVTRQAQVGNAVGDVINAGDASEKAAGDVRTATTVLGDIKEKVVGFTTSISNKDDGKFKKQTTGINDQMTIQSKVADGLRGVVEGLVVQKSQLDSAQSNIDKMQSTIEKQVSNIEDLKKSLEISNTKYMRILIILSVVLIAISGMMFFNKPTKESLSIGVGGVVLLMTSLTVQHFSERFAMIGFISIAVALGIIAIKIFQYSQIEKEKKKTEDGFAEVVETLEVAKSDLSPEAKEKIFGKINTNGEAGAIQSKETKQKVLEVRKVINEKNKPTMTNA